MLANNFTISSSFGTSVFEGSLSNIDQGSGDEISFTITQIEPQVKSVYVALVPVTNQTSDFWDDFWSNKIGGNQRTNLRLVSSNQSIAQMLR